MAVSSKVPGIEVTVRVAGQALKEYDTENDQIINDDPAVVAHQEDCTVTKFVEVITGQVFELEYNVKSPPYQLDCPNLGFHLYVDGNWVSTRYLAAMCFKSGSWRYACRGPTNWLENKESVDEVTLMQFAELKSTTEMLNKSVIGTQMDQVDAVGSICIEIFRESKGTACLRTVVSSFKGCDSSDKYHEKVLVQEAKSHGVSLGIKKNIPKSQVISCELLDGSDFPLAIFAFKYRSAESLRALRVLPREESVESTSPDVPREDADGSEDDNLDDLSDLTPSMKARFERMLARAKRGAKSKSVKSEIKSENASAPTIKRDHSDDEEDVKPSKRAKTTKKKMIGKTIVDLTDIDEEEAEAAIELD